MFYYTTVFDRVVVLDDSSLVNRYIDRYQYADFASIVYLKQKTT
jgi:hypothetical protein